EPPRLGNPQSASWFETLRQDVRYTLRRLRLTPGFTSVSVVTLALGIGACTLILSAVDAVLLRPPPFRAPERLAVFWGTAPDKGLPEVELPEGLVALYRDRAHSFESFAGFVNAGANLTGDADAERVSSAQITPEFFSTLGVTPSIGRVPA